MKRTANNQVSIAATQLTVYWKFLKQCPRQQYGKWDFMEEYPFSISARVVRRNSGNWQSDLSITEYASAAPSCNVQHIYLAFINLRVQPDLTALLRFLSGVSLEVSSLIHSVRPLSGLPNLYVQCSIVTHVTNTASEYQPTLGADIKSRTTI